MLSSRTSLRLFRPQEQAALTSPKLTTKGGCAFSETTRDRESTALPGTHPRGPHVDSVSYLTVHPCSWQLVLKDRERVYLRRRGGEMNTDITASVKPEYPVVDRNPPFTKTVANFNTLDYLRLLTITGVSVTVGYLSGIRPNIRGPSMVTGGLIGVMGGFMYAYQNSAGRLMGFFPNEGEVQRYKKA
ncbi:hypothetical protein BHE74_00035482 [Ensete ventricosum]|nr:hypothetical protein BHE74_00035482 [Ensete ventricosum]